jgi:hypothetical protein
MGDWHGKLEHSQLQLIICIKSIKEVPPNEMTYAANYSPQV